MALEERPSVCTFDCPDACSLSVRSMTARSSRCAARARCRTPPASSAARWRATCRLRARTAAPVASAAPHRAEGLGAVRAHRLGCRAGRGPRAGRGSHRPLGAAGGDAAQLRRPARPSRLRQHVAALLPPARRHPALPARPVRRGAQRGLGRDLRRGARLPARIRRAGQAQRRLGQQRDGRESASGAQHPQGEARRRPARRDRPAAHQDRRAGRSAPAIAARHRRPARLVACRRARAPGALDDAFIAAHVLGFDEFMARARNGRRRGRPRPAGCRRSRS